MTIPKPFPPSQLDGAHAIGPEKREAAPTANLDLLVMLRILRVRRSVILGTAAAVVALTLIILFQLTPLYSASAIVMLDQRKNNVTDVSMVLSGLPTDQAGVQNQVQILTSRDLAGRVIDRLDLKDDPKFNMRNPLARYVGMINPLAWIGGSHKTQDAALAAEEARNAEVDHFEKNLIVAPIGLSTAIKVTYSAPDARLAAKITNAIADAYVEDQLNAKFDATQKTTRWLADRIQELSRQSQAADAAVQEYRAANGLTETADGESVVDQQMAAISAQLVTAKSDMAEKEATYAHVASLARQGRAADISQAVASPLIATLRGQEAELMRQEADLSSKYGPRNPKMLDLQSQKANLEGKIVEEVNRVVQSVANDVSIAQAHVNSLEASLNRSEGKSGQQNQLKVKLAALQSASSSAKSMYEAFLSKLNQTQDQQGIQTPDARIISKAREPMAAAYPDKLLVIGIAIPAGFLLGLVLAFMLERLDSGFRTTAQIESLLGLPVLATIPELMSRGRKENAADRVVDRPLSSFSEAIRGLHLALTLSNIDKQPKVVVVTSAVPGEGKTTTSVSLARLAARSGYRTVLIDADLRRPAIAASMNLENLAPGLIEALSGALPLDQCLVKDPMSDAVLLSCVKKPVNPSDILSSQAMKQLIANLSRVFDLVIIDSAPVLPVHDTKILAQLADSVLFVTRWEKTPREGVVNALKSLADVHIPVAGIALTRADMKRFQYYSYGYQDYYYYNKYYVG